MKSKQRLRLNHRNKIRKINREYRKNLWNVLKLVDKYLESVKWRYKGNA